METSCIPIADLFNGRHPEQPLRQQGDFFHNIGQPNRQFFPKKNVGLFFACAQACKEMNDTKHTVKKYSIFAFLFVGNRVIYDVNLKKSETLKIDFLWLSSVTEQIFIGKLRVNNNEVLLTFRRWLLIEKTDLLCLIFEVE